MNIFKRKPVAKFDLEFIGPNSIPLTEENFYVLLMTQQKSLDQCKSFTTTFSSLRRKQLYTCLHIYQIYQTNKNKLNIDDLLELNTHELRLDFYGKYCMCL